MDSDQRLKAQEQFDQGTARVVVATVAFGMGVDKGSSSYSIVRLSCLLIILRTVEPSSSCLFLYDL